MTIPSPGGWDKQIGHGVRRYYPNKPIRQRKTIATPAYLEVQLRKVRRQWHQYRFQVRLPFLHHLRPGAESGPLPPAKNPVLSSVPCQAKYVH